METFKPDIGSEELPRFTVMTGAQLRQRYVEKLRVQEQRVMINSALDPDSLTEGDLEMFNAWLKTMAESKYPDEGDYKVRILEDNGDPVTEFGEDYEFITSVGYLPADCGDCRAIELNISQTDLDNATGNTDPLLNGKISLFYNDCDGILLTTGFDTAGIQFKAGVCAKSNADLLYFQYYNADNPVTTGYSSLATRSDKCCEEIIP